MGFIMQEYTVDIGGLEHTVLLSDEEAKARGLKVAAKAEPKAAAAPANKARTPQNKSS